MLTGLTELPDADLKRLLAAVHHGQVGCPLSIVEVTRIGLQHRSEALLGALGGLDARAVTVALGLVFAERRAAAGRLEAERRGHM